MTEKSLQIFSNEGHFELAQRQAKALSQSTLIPKDFQGNISNCLIALEISNRLEISPFIVFQNLFVIHGKPGFSASFVIAQINSSGRFAQPLQFRVEGEGDARHCIAWTNDHNGVIQEGPPVSIAMAKAEGWYGKQGSKWKTMSDVMLRYRAATFFGRLYTPELLLGMQTTEELRDVGVIDVTPEPAAKAKAAAEQAMNGDDLGETIAAKTDDEVLGSVFTSTKPAQGPEIPKDPDLGQAIADEINEDLAKKKAPAKKRGRKPAVKEQQKEIDEFKQQMDLEEGKTND